MVPKIVMYVMLGFFNMLILSIIVSSISKNKKVIIVISSIQTLVSMICIIIVRSMFIEHLLNWCKKLGTEELSLISAFDEYLTYILIGFVITLVILIVINQFTKFSKKTILNCMIITCFFLLFTLLGFTISKIFDISSYKMLLNLAICNLLCIPFSIHKIKEVSKSR